jgi:rod shape determining protein RodA
LLELSSAPKDKGLIKSVIVPFSLVLLLALLIFQQPDLGTACMLLLIFFIILFLSYVKLRLILSLVLGGLILTPIFWHFLKDYQKDRLLVFINPNSDPLGAGYTIIQSKIAIGSGWFFGKGWLKGTQGQLHFLPEGHTDFIFATFAEEWGFFGVAVLMCLYYLLIKECIRISLTTSDSFGRLLGLGISFSLAIQILINIAMTIGLCPVVGLPLPLMSYGGSSLIVTFISLAIIKNISWARTVF